MYFCEVILLNPPLNSVSIHGLIILYGGNKQLYYSDDVKKDKGFYGGNKFFFQITVSDYSVLEMQLELVIENKAGTRNIYNNFDLEKLEGDLQITEMENNSHDFFAGVIDLHFKGTHIPEYDYRLQIYGPDHKRVYHSIIDADLGTHHLDLSKYKKGMYLFCISKHSQKNNYNFVSREYRAFFDVYNFR